MNREPMDFDEPLKVPPNDLLAEASVLGALLQDNSAFDRVGDVLAEADFYLSEHRTVYAAMSAMLLAGKATDVITVFDHLGERAEEIGGLSFLNSLAQQVPSASNIRRYAEIVREKSVRRQVGAAGNEIAASVHEANTSPDALIDAAQQRIMALGEGVRADGDDWVEAADGMVEHTQLLERRHAGEITAWPTGLTDLDEYLEGGLRPGELVIVGARPSMGKTALAMSIGVHMAADRPVAMLSMEMSHQEVRDRLTAMLGHVSLSAVKRPARGEGLNWTSVVEGIDRAKQLRLRISDKGGLNINQVRTKARNAKRRGGLEVLVVDYIGLMTGLDPKANRNTQLGEISRGLKNLAKELGICVLCLAQLNRKAEERADQMPQMSDLRDSGEIEQDADVILFIKRPIMSNPDLGPDWQHYAKLSVAKNRQGRCGHLHLSYLGEQTRFTGWAGEPPSKTSTKHGGGGL